MMDAVIQFRGTIYENGYGMIAAKVMRDKTLPKQSRLIYAYMCSFASVNQNGERVAFPSVSLQCAELDMNKDTYYKWREILIKRGLISIEKRKDKGKFERNLYFIEAVPVTKNEVDPEKKASEDLSEKPFPKKSDTVKSDTKKSDTNSINSNNINFNNYNNLNINNDDKRTSFAKHNDVKQINLLISNFREMTKEDLSERSFKSVVRKVVDKYNQGEINSFRDYLATALIRKIEELEFRRQKDKAKQQIKTSSLKKVSEKLTNFEVSKLPFYNWLDE